MRRKTTKLKFPSGLKLSKKQKKHLIIAGSSLGAVILLIYLGFALYFNSHFFFGTTINEIDCSKMTVTEAKKAIQQYMDTYILTIEERNSKTEQIISTDFDLKSEFTVDLSEFKEKQNNFAWPVSLFKDYNYTAESQKSYNKDKLEELIDQLDCMQEQNMIEAENASLQLSGNTYEIVAEKKGTQVDREKVHESIQDAVKGLASTLNLEKSGCYIEPAFTSENEKLKEAVQTLNNCVSAKITYNILGHTEIIDSQKIIPWLSWNEEFDVDVSSSGVADLVKGWASSYNTSGKAHTLDTSYGTTVTIDKGNYGWKIDASSTSSELIQAIRNGEQTTKEPVYSSKANSKDTSKDYGNTYVEINLGTQHLFYYKDGSLVVESDFVSGKVTNGNATPTGIYGLTYKQSPAVLRGPGYASPVKYWMPFNGGVGMHDASWRHGKFGGNIFYSNGSHGCINLPTAAAKTIYENITANCAVIVYDQKIETQPLDDVSLTDDEVNAANNEQDANSASEAGVTDVTPEVPIDNTASSDTGTLNPPTPEENQPAVPDPEPTPAPTDPVQPDAQFPAQ